MKHICIFINATSDVLQFIKNNGILLKEIDVCFRFWNIEKSSKCDSTALTSFEEYNKLSVS
jgi:hypothetical protein